MNEFIEKLVSRLEEKKREHLHDEEVTQGLGKINLASFCSAKARALDGAIQIVNQLAGEYNNGWIPYVTGCEMPNEASRVWLSFTTPIASFVKSAWYINGHFEWDNCKRVKETPMAWKPYDIPAPYQPKGSD